jgi:hypothetical protein
MNDKKNLCEKCSFDPATCPATNIVFGCDIPDGNKSDDNVIDCDAYTEI